VIPRDYITQWRAQVPWVQDFQVEQDLIISRALVAIFTDPLLGRSLAFRGGTALYKLHIKPPARYSEVLDLVQIHAEPAGPVMDALRAVIDPWLGKPQWKQTEGRVTFLYRYESEDIPPLRLRLKVEINSREHFAVYGFRHAPFAVSSRWFEGGVAISAPTCWTSFSPPSCAPFISARKVATCSTSRARSSGARSTPIASSRPLPNIWTAAAVASRAPSLSRTWNPSCAIHSSTPTSARFCQPISNGTQKRLLRSFDQV
jgi:hypothetical protein